MRGVIIIITIIVRVEAVGGTQRSILRWFILWTCFWRKVIYLELPPSLRRTCCEAIVAADWHRPYPAATPDVGFHSALKGLMPTGRDHSFCLQTDEPKGF